MTKRTKIRRQAFEFENCNMDWHFFPLVKSRVRRLRLLREWGTGHEESEKARKLIRKKRRKNLRRYPINVVDMSTIFGRYHWYNISIWYQYNVAYMTLMFDCNIVYASPSVNCNESLLTRSYCMLVLMFHLLNDTYKPLHKTYTL